MGLTGCQAIYAQNDAASVVSAAEQATVKGSSTAAQPASPPGTEKSADQSPDALKSFTDRITSFFNNPDIVSLWTHNTWRAWLMLLVWIFLGVVSGKICSALLQKAGSRNLAVPTRFLLDLAGPANLFLIAAGLSMGLLWIQMSDYLKLFALRMMLLMFYISVFWYAYNLISVVDLAFHRVGKKTDSSLAMHIAPLLRRTLRVFLLVIAAMFIVQSVFKQDIGAWLAGLGIAGLAVSLAAQDSLKNLFGSVTIILDRSFKIGERIICSGCNGVIEDIGLRTTTDRTTDGSRGLHSKREHRQQPY